MRRSLRLRQRTWICLLLLVISGAVVLAHPIHAATATSFSVESIGGQVGLGNADLKQVILNVIRWALGIVTLAAVVYMIYGGYLWMTAAGNESRVEKAKQVILQAAIGLVICLLAWAIVYFVAKTVANTTTNSSGGNGTGCGLNCPPPPPLNTFDITAVTSCAVAPNYSKDVPLSSGVSLTFNADLSAASVSAAIPVDLQIKQCDASGNCANTANPQTPTSLSSQVFTPGSQPVGKIGSVKSEWVANKNSLTFYHLSFSDQVGNRDNQYFKPNTTYQITIPRDGNNKAVTDIAGRVLEHCQRAPGVPIIGDSFIGEHCQETPTAVIWQFTTGQDATGQPLNVSGTTPSSSYLTDPTLTPDRNVPRNAVLGINFDGGLDPASATMDNFLIYKFTVPPSQAGKWLDGTPDPVPLPAADFNMEMNGTGTGVWVQYQTGKLFEAFTWYKIVAKDFRNLCGTTMQPPTLSWVFETNDVTPGVAQVYPTNGFQAACPTTKVMIQFNTSMWDITKGSTCVVNATSSYSTHGELDLGSTQVSNRSFDVLDPVPLIANPDPNKYCKTFAFVPETAGLSTGQYHVGVTTDLTIDVNGTKLSYGDQPPLPSPPTEGSGWSFAVKPPGQCYQPPVVTRVDPNEDANGACVSVLGDYFTDPAFPSPPTVYPRPNDKLTLGANNQSAKSWATQSIVSTVDATNLAAGKTYDYQVTVDYPAPIGPLQSLTSDSSKFMLDGGLASNRPCLFSVNPSQGLPGSLFSASGQYLGTSGTVHRDDGSDPWALSSSTGNWADTKITDIQVSGLAPVRPGNVWVTVGNKDSNQLPFEVTAPAVQQQGAPQVVEDGACDVGKNVIPSPNPFKGDTTACRNAVIAARFSMEMEPSTLNSSTILLDQCANSTTCTQPVPYNLQYLASDHSIQLLTTTAMQANTLYQVTLTTGVKAAGPNGAGTTPVGPPLSQPYTWQFTTTGQDCQITQAVVQPNSPITFTQSPFPPPLPQLTGLGTDNACHIINTALGTTPTTYNWGNTDPTVAALVPTNQQTTTVSDPGGTPTAGSTNATITMNSNITSNAVKITYAPNTYACNTTSDCSKNELGESCGNSTCVAGKCTPIINSLNPDSGPIGTWTTIKGCWFGNYDSNTSKVLFTDNQLGLTPNPLICGPASQTWNNYEIVIEVPDKSNSANNAVTGPVTVTRSDSVVASSANANPPDPFTVNGAAPLGPGLCKLNPNGGASGLAMTASGQGFGMAQTATSDVNYTPVGTSSSTSATSYPSWGDSSVVSTVPAGLTNGGNDVRVKNSGVNSNPRAFMVNNKQCPPPGVICVFGNSSSCPTGYGCGYDGCCAAQPKVIDVAPPAGGTNVCRNTVADVTFDRPIDPSSVQTQGANATYIWTEAGTGQLKGSASIEPPIVGTGSTLRYFPGLLKASALEAITITAGIRGANGVPADPTWPVGAKAGSFNHTFTTGTNICALDHVIIDPNADLFTAVNETHPGYLATAWPANSQAQIEPITKVYDWTWGWQDIADPIAAPAASSTNTTSVTAKANGTTTVSATATISADTVLKPSTVGQTFTGSSQVNVSFCVNPRSFDDTTDGATCDTGGACGTYNFRMSYCRDQNSGLLPDFSYHVIEGVNAQDPTRLKSYFFKAGAGTQDAIGLLIYDNPNYLSPLDWFHQRFPLDSGASSTTVAGYPAVKSGTTTYIGVTDLEAGQLLGRIFVFDYNSNNAAPATQNIYGQLLQSLIFNTNKELGSIDKARIIRDTQRRQDLANIKLVLNQYKATNGTYPTLPSGSYVAGLSTSLWPSWTQTLGSSLKATLPTDPVNTFGGKCLASETTACSKNSQCMSPYTCTASTNGFCSLYEQTTCWAEPVKTFTCPANSHLYAYRVRDNGQAFDLYAAMEFTGTGGFAGATQNACDGLDPSTCSCFNFNLHSS